MPPSRLETRFHFEAKRLALAEGRSEASVVKCPTCLAEFGWQDMLVGRLTATLTCKVCNNTQGSGIDKHVVEAARTREAFAGYGVLRSTVSIGDAKFEAELALKPDPSETNVITVIQKASNPRQVEAGMHHLRSGAQELNLSISFGYNQNRLLRGILRAAYLVVFHHDKLPVKTSLVVTSRTLSPRFRLQQFPLDQDF